MKKTISILLIACMLCAFVTGCASPATIPAETAAPAPAPAPAEAPVKAGIYTPGTYTATAAGFGGAFEVTVKVDANNILEVAVGTNSETAGIGTNAIDAMPALFVEKNSADVDGVSGCTVTSTALKDAVRSALNKAMGKESSSEVSLNDGSYTANVVSYSETNGLPDGNGDLTVKMTVANNAITDIEVVSYSDTEVIGGMAFPMLIDSIIETQSLGVDTITGATISSNAFILAVSNCVTDAGGDAAAMKARPVEKRGSQSKKYDTDIVVIGAGIAGLTAAIQAANEGANVILLEKSEVLSSSTTRSVGFVMGADTDVQRANGITGDTWEKFYKDIYACYKDEPELDTNLLKIAARNSVDLIPFLQECGVEFATVKNVSPMEPRATKRTHVTEGGGSKVSSALLNKAQELGVQILFGTPAVELIMDNGAVLGCKAKNKYGDDITINASATILAAGSYSNNPELFAKLNPRADNVEFLAGSGDGDAYMLSVAANADIVEIPYPQIMFYFYSASWPVFPEVLPASPDFNIPDHLRVDGGGERVASEDDFCFEYVKENWERGYSEGYAIGGKAFGEKYPNAVEMALTSTVSASGLPFGYKADTIEELAKAVGIDPAVLTATVNRYNELCDSGVDKDFGKASEYMVKLEAPYYILRLPQIATDGYTGARINENSQVIDVNGKAIPGFYAAGSCAVGQMTGVNYFGCGTSLLIGGVYGRIAASHAVETMKK